MSDNLDLLWNKAKDLKHDAHRFTDNPNVHGLINDLIDSIEVAMSEEEYGDYDDEDNVIDFMIEEG